MERKRKRGGGGGSSVAHPSKPNQETTSTTFFIIKKQQQQQILIEEESSLLMAPFNNNESSSSSSSSDSDDVIDKLGVDHLLSILLLIPTTSILTFAITCKKIYSFLLSSNLLWESLCKRDWGNLYVDSIINSSFHNHTLVIPWFHVYKHIYLLDSLSCLSLSPAPTDHDVSSTPGGRASHSLNFLSNCFLLFGGGSHGGRHLDDTWVAYIGNNYKQRLTWQKISSGVPSGRFGHSCVVLGDTIVLFGGINEHGIRQNDTWVCHLVFHENNRTTLSWKLLDVGPTAPPARGAHAGCCIDSKHKMLIHGGIGLSGLRLEDTWFLEISENTLFGTWHEIVTHPTPSARSGHSATYVGENKTILFGGRGTGYEVLSDVWLFDSNQLQWVPLYFELRNIPGGVSLPRVGHSATLILGGRLLIYGGEDSNRHRKDDYWVLDFKPISSFGCMWRRLEVRGYKPKARSFHQACTDLLGRYMYVFGGMVDELIHPGESSELRFDNELFLVEIVLQM